MDLESQQINDKVLTLIANKYDLSKKDVIKLLQIHREFIVDTINSIDLTKDISKKPNRVVMPFIGDIRISKVFIFGNDLFHGNLERWQFDWAKRWFKGQFVRWEGRKKYFNKYKVK